MTIGVVTDMNRYPHTGKLASGLATHRLPGHTIGHTYFFPHPVGPCGLLVSTSIDGRLLAVRSP